MKTNQSASPNGSTVRISTPYGGIPPIGFFLVEIRGAGSTIPRGASSGFMVASMESYLKDTDLAGLAFALAMARQMPREYRSKTDASTRCFGVCPHT